MSCQKCNPYLNLPRKSSAIYFISEFDEIKKKIERCFSKLEIAYSETDDLIKISCKNPEQFLQNFFKEFKECFSQIEQEVIKLFIETENEKLNYRSVLFSKSLEIFLNHVEDREFFDILEKRNLTSYFQPILEVESDTLFGYEALIRGIKSDGSIMYPNEFFEKTARNDLNFMVDRVCRETALQSASNSKIEKKIFINFMPTAIYDPEFCLQTTMGIAKKLNLNFSNIIFEVIETELVKDQKHLQKILNFYKKQGFKIALDDVGEGYSNLNLLIDMKPDIIKIDRNIISEIDKSPMKKSVYKALYDIANSNGIKVLAEGIERIEEFKTLKSIGVDFVQGFYFGKPTPV